MDKSIFYQQFDDGNFKLIDSTILPYKFYFGKTQNGLFTLEYRGQFNKASLKANGTIDVKTGRSSNESFVWFSLLNDNLFDTFVIFCCDLIECASIAIDAQEGYEKICNRYYVWKKMFSNTKKLLGEEQIKGLIGELLFLKDVMFPIYGYTRSLQSWSGQSKTKKDFSINDDWYEIKTIDVGKPSVGISSLEQLESDTDGQLCVYQLEKMSETYDGITLNKLFSEIVNLFNLQMDIDIFTDIMLTSGYTYNSEYDTIVYEVRQIDKYRVDNQFPKLSHNNVSTAIIKARYEIALSEIENFKI